MRRNPARTRRSGAVAAGLRRLSRTVVVDALRSSRAGLRRPLRATRTEHRAAAERGRADEGRRCQVEWIHRVLFSMPHMPAQARFLPERFMNCADQRSPAKSAARPRRRRNEHDVFYAGERLGIARRLTGMSQQRLADHLGVSFQAVHKYESGQNRLCRPAGRGDAGASRRPRLFRQGQRHAKPRTEASPRASAPTSSTSSGSTARSPTRRSPPVAPAGADDSAGCGVGRER
jgi:DNA-binding XRE family transcriptional regulator